MMKRNIITKGLLGMIAFSAVSFSMTSCSDDYLDLAPITDVSSNTVTSTITGAEAAFVGLCNGMYRSNDSENFGFNGPNGEPWILGFYGEGMGNACIKGIWTYSASFVNSYSNWTYMNTSSSGATYYMWAFCYNVIDDANNLIKLVDGMEASEEDEDELAYIKASALTIRAHYYTLLLQTYAPRWADSNNGNTYCVILRTEPSTTENMNKDFSTMSEVLDQIYADLDEAIEIYENTSYSRGTNLWMPNINVAQGLYARAALLQNDYNTALTMASEAMADYPIMSADEYRQGFVYANSEYIWASSIDNQDLGWDTFGSWTAFNGYYTGAFGISDAIDYKLYQNISMTDCRKLLYFTPELVELTPNLSGDYGLDPDAFFYTTSNAENPGMISENTSTYKINAPGPYREGYYFLLDYGLGEGADEGYESALSSYYTNLSEVQYFIQPQFGSAFKFWGVDEYAFNEYPFMRASEMGYIVAECQYRLGNTSAAQQMMNTLNTEVRDPEFNCTLTGDELLAQIKAYREIELWGEGFNWFDLKRWGDPCVRTHWEAGNPDSGNWGSLLKSFEPSAMAGWRYAVPLQEFTYNKAADPEKVKY